MAGKKWREARRDGAEYLKREGISDAETDSRILLEFAGRIDRTYYSLHAEETVPDPVFSQYEDLLRRRAARVPTQYLTGEAWFYGRRFEVSPAVLIPRQDTECLVEEALLHAEDGDRVLDLCTGSGCVLLTLLLERHLSGTGADLSEDALCVARKNQELLCVPDVTWVHSDLFAEIRGEFALITANPPYIASDVIDTLEPEVRGHEPRMALDGHQDGLFFLKKIAEEAPAFLSTGGWLCMETGYDQGGVMASVLRDLKYEEVHVVRDLSGLDRVIVGRKK